MTKAMERLAKARLEERVARARWFTVLDEVQDRTTASHLANELIDGIKDAGSALADKAVDTARKRPGLVTAIGTGIALFFMRRPIANLVRTQLSKRKETSEPAQPFDEDNPNFSDPEPLPHLAPRPTMTEEI